MPMTFFEGKDTLKDGTAVRYPRLNKVPGQVIITKDGTSLPNGTYEDSTGKHFTVAGGVIGQLDVAAPEVIIPEVKPDPVIETENKNDSTAADAAAGASA